MESDCYAPLCTGLLSLNIMSMRFSHGVARISRWFFLSFLKDFIYLFLERREGKEKEGETHGCVVASHAPPTGDLACNPGMCPELRIELVTLWFTVQHSIH